MKTTTPEGFPIDIPPGKKSKTEMGYKDFTLTNGRCGACINYIPVMSEIGDCEVVEGVIRAHGRCNLFMSKYGPARKMPDPK